MSEANPTYLARRLNQIQKQQQKNKTNEQFSRFIGLPFWIEDPQEHAAKYKSSNSSCCFQHALPAGPPSKNGKYYPIFDYQLDLIKLLEGQQQQHVKHVWIKKSVGIGGTELLLRYFAWLACRNNSLQEKSICIVVGPRIELAISLIERLKNLFKPDPTFVFEDKMTVCYVNGVRFECFPSNHTDSMRGLTNLAGIIYDECDFFAIHEQENVLHLATRYAIKEPSAIQVMISTPNRPGGLYERIEQDSKSMFHKVYWPYQIGLGKIYSVKEVEAARKQPGFSREMELQYGGGLGNAFNHSDIERAIELGKNPLYDYDNPTNPNYGYRFRNTCSLGVDPGYSSSKFGVCLTQMRNNKYVVVFSEEFEKASFTLMVDYVVRIIMQRYKEIRCYVDASQPEFIRAVKQRLMEPEDYEAYIARKRRELMLPPKKPLILEHFMKCIPVDFRSHHEDMLSKTRALLELGLIAIPPKKHEKLILSLRTAMVVDDEDNRLDKSQTSFNDIFDAFRLSLERYIVVVQPQQKIYH